MSSTLRLFWEAAGGNVPEHWEFKTIDELLEHPKSISVGVMYPGSDTASGVPLIKVSDVKNGAIASRPSFCISSKVDEEYRRTRLNGSELLLTLVGNPGDCVIVTDEMCGWNVARALAVIRLKDTQLRSWIRYVLASKPAQHLIEARLNTTVQKTLNLKDVREIGIPIPPKEERDSITKIIDSIEKKTLVNTQINQTLESIVQAIFKSWFIDFDPVRAKIAAKQEGKDPELAAMCAISGKSEIEFKQMAEDDFAELQATAALFPDELVESELGEVPKGWEVKALDRIASYQNGLALQKFRPENENEFLPIVKIAQLKSGIATIEEKASPNIDAKSIIDNGDVVFSWSGSLVVDIWCGGKAALNQHLFKVTSNQYPKWLYYYYTKHHLAEFQRIAQAKAVTMGHIKREHLSQALCTVPCEKILDASGILESVLQKQIKFRLENNNLMKIRDALLPKLLSGEIDVSGLQGEVA
ncbi:MAG: restriction endonuclease subunit S [Acinetobacter populi]|uniref:restriction endonuclease subunit S n=1 Tax=Acinetobacter populi TaxID=1582270 RepID=UPI002352AFE5|nr:restriction endonuclease subunit S [Acinetobacter populi]MCH4247004.1 restriction endonuclease subunit S [Acinetobacter populi]